jgi:hypothetical protein
MRAEGVLRLMLNVSLYVGMTLIEDGKHVRSTVFEDNERRLVTFRVCPFFLLLILISSFSLIFPPPSASVAFRRPRYHPRPPLHLASRLGSSLTSSLDLKKQLRNSWRIFKTIFHLNPIPNHQPSILKLDLKREKRRTKSRTLDHVQLPEGRTRVYNRLGWCDCIVGESVNW